MDLKTLCELNGPSGSEQPVRKYIFEEAQKLCDDVHIDRMGNVICRKKGSKQDAPHVALAAHMDEVGFIEEIRRRHAAHTPDRRHRPRAIVSKWVIVNGETPGIIGAKAIHLQTKEEREKVLNLTACI